MSLIIPQLFVSNYKTALNKQFLLKNNITTVINCTTNVPFTSLPNVINRYRLPVKDNKEPREINIMTDLLPKTCKLISKHIKLGENVLVHCHAGRQRSVVVVMAYLIYKYGHNVTSSLELISSRHQNAGLPELNFKLSISRFYNYFTHLRR